MYTQRAWGGAGLAFVFCLSVPAARADVITITPNSVIPFVPAPVGSANGTPISSPGGLVTWQYQRLGLEFSSTTASTTTITTLDGVKVWAPASPSGQLGPGNPGAPVGSINYNGTWAGMSFVLPGPLPVTSTAASLSVEIIGRQNLGFLVNYANNPGVTVPATVEMMTPQPNGGTVYTFQAGPGIRSLSIVAPAIDPPPGAAPPDMAINPAWGVAKVSFTLTPNPEPSSLILAGLGALGLATRFGRRRTRDKVE